MCVYIYVCIYVYVFKLSWKGYVQIFLSLYAVQSLLKYSFLIMQCQRKYRQYGRGMFAIKLYLQKEVADRICSWAMVY
jgi:hypothetical protein